MAPWMLDDPPVLACTVHRTSVGGFSVTVAEEDSLYERGHWTVIMGTGPQTRYSGALTPRVTLPK